MDHDGDQDAVDPMEDFIERITTIGSGHLFAVAAAFHPDDPTHAAAWAEVHTAAAAEGMEPEIERLKRRVAQWATRGTGYVAGHLGVGPADEMLHVARTAAAGAILDAGVAEMMDAVLTDATLRVLLRPWGLPELDDEAPGDSV